MESIDTVQEIQSENTDIQVDNPCLEKYRDTLIEYSGQKLFDFICSKLSSDKNKVSVVATTTLFNIQNQQFDQYNTIINLKKVNDVRYLNKFFETINAKLPVGGVYINSVETFFVRKWTLLKKYPWGINYIIYSIDFFFRRMCPKLAFTKRFYFYITGGKNRLLSRAETFGRLYSCGFEIVDEKEINEELYFIARKVKDPDFNAHPTYGPFIKLKRHGKDGKIFKVYKFRTMHSYSEYLQDYVNKNYGLDEGGKFKDDFRVTTLGRIMRKLWIDEFPMFINVFKGQMKLVGVRPLSRQYFNMYTDELKEKRSKFKPGLVPPFYVDMPKTLEEIMASEMKYLTQYEKHPFLTDWKYFWKSFYNIVFKRARSK